MVEEHDVVVVGAGPGGTQAARAAAEQGVDVLLLEEHPEVGVPVSCGEGISKEALESFGFPVYNASYYRYKVENLKVILPNNTHLKYKINGTVISRADFDKYLADLAVNAGAELRTSHKVTNATRNKNGFTITINKQDKETITVNTKILIDATGPSARISKLIGHPHPTKHVYGVEYRMTNLHTESLDFYFDLKKYPKGYVWIFPKAKNISNIGIVTTSPHARQKLDEFIKEHDIKGDIQQVIGGTIPRTGPITPSYENNFLAVGDAAGMANAVFYGGIRIALQTGWLAGKTAAQAIKKNDTTTKTLKNYEKQWKKYPFASNIIPKTHHLFYEHYKNQHLNDLGTTFNGTDLANFPITGYLKILKKMLTNKFYFKNTKNFYTIIRGFQITAEWGY